MIILQLSLHIFMLGMWYVGLYLPACVPVPVQECAHMFGGWRSVAGVPFNLSETYFLRQGLSLSLTEHV